MSSCSGGDELLHSMNLFFVLVISCPPPVPPQNGIVIDDGVEHTFNNEVMYECHQGFLLEGRSSGRCNENATWGEVPSCVCEYQILMRTFHWKSMAIYNTYSYRLVINASCIVLPTENAAFLEGGCFSC